MAVQPYAISVGWSALRHFSWLVSLTPLQASTWLPRMTDWLKNGCRGCFLGACDQDSRRSVVLGSSSIVPVLIPVEFALPFLQVAGCSTTSDCIFTLLEGCPEEDFVEAISAYVLLLGTECAIVAIVFD